jgi:hypothetical protein
MAAGWADGPNAMEGRRKRFLFLFPNFLRNFKRF